MKKIFKYTLVLSAAIIALASCKKEVEDVYTPAVAEASDCMGVYFPVQEASGTHQLEPTAPTEVTILVSRPEDKSASEAKVKFSLVETKDGETVSGVFKADDIVFAAGQTETSFTLSFDNTEVGIPYTCTIVLEEGQYASVYGSGNTQFVYGVTRVKWKELGIGLWREDIFSGTMGSYVSPLNPVWEVSIYERDDLPGMYRIYNVYTEENITNWLAEGFKEYHEGTIEDLIIEVNATNPNKVWIPYTFIGWQFYSNGPFYFGSLVDENIPILADMDGYTSSANYGTIQDGLITFPARALCYGFSDEEWWGRANTNGMFYIALPGVTPVDYSIKLASALSEEGVTPITVTVGMDVEKIKYAVYEGELNAAQAANRAAAIIDGSDESEEFSDFTPNAVGSAKIGTMGVSSEDTGVYTLVAVTYDKDGKEQNSASVGFTYVSEENPVPVVINCGLEVTGKYEPQGNTKENSLEYYVYGEDIVDAKIGVYKYIDIASKGYDAIVANLTGSASAPAEVIEAINNGGYIGIASGLVPGTEFYLFVWASNGYEQTVIVSDSATTEGDPLPIYMDYTTSDYYGDGEFETREDTYGVWNYYGLDASGSLGIREYLGQVTISASETETEGPDDSGLYDEYVYVEGLFGDLSWLTDYDMSTEATLEMDVYAGIMYQFGDSTVEGDYAVYLGAKGQNEFGYTVNYASAFIPVADGYYAFVDCSRYASSYNFCGIGLYSDAGWIARIWDPLLVDPDVDDNGVAPEAAKASRALFQDVVSHHKENFVETEKGRIMSIIDEYKTAVRNYFNPIRLDSATFTPKQVKMTVVSMDPVQEKSQELSTPGFLPKEIR